MQISELVGKRIFSEEGRELGYALSVMLTKNRAKIVYMLCADENEEEFMLPARALVSCGDVVVASDRRLAVAPAAYPPPVGLPVYSDAGLYLGTVCDLCFENDGAELILTGTDTRYPVTNAKIGQAVILKKQTKSAPARTDKTKKPAPSPEKGMQTTQQPSAARPLDRVNILGRKVKKTVYAQNGIPLAWAGDKITAQTIAKARQENLLLRLTVDTLTNL